MLVFRNPNDPTDKTFDPHPTDYPVVELEYPNSGACERYVCLEKELLYINTFEP
jgi:H3 lysine-79-specific histone-lysine N-methyltransferase